MTEPQNEHQKALEDIDRLMAEAPDEAARNELRALRERLNSPELRAMAREAAEKPVRPRRDLSLDFHDPLVPGVVTSGGTVACAAVCLFAVLAGFRSPSPRIAGIAFDPWLWGAAAGAICVTLIAISFFKSFSAHFDTLGMTTRTSGARWSKLRVGAMRWEDVRSIEERAADKVLEVRGAHGQLLEVPMRVVNYPILRAHLANMVMLYGDRR